MTRCSLFKALLFALVLTPTWASASSDPTAPLGFEPQQPAIKKQATRLPTLDAILCSDTSDCTAVLSGVGKRKGERINGYIVKDVNENQVVLQRNSKRWTLAVFNQQVLQ